MNADNPIEMQMFPSNANKARYANSFFVAISIYHQYKDKITSLAIFANNHVNLHNFYTKLARNRKASHFAKVEPPLLYTSGQISKAGDRDTKT